MIRRALAIRLRPWARRATPTPPRATGALGAAARLRPGKPAEAEAMIRRALAIRLEALGEATPTPIGRTMYSPRYSIARTSLRRRLHFWEAAAEAMRRLDTEQRKGSNRPHCRRLASSLGGRGVGPGGTVGRRLDPLGAGAGRGILDEVAGRALRPSSAEEKDREIELLSRSQAIDERIGRLLDKSSRSQEEDRRLEELRRQESDLRRQSLDHEHQLEAKYGALAGKPAGLDEVRRAIPEPAALVGWVDAGPHHWACVLRRTGDPTWVRLPGSGPGGDWTKDDEDLPRRLRGKLAPGVDRGDGRALAGALARQRLGPLADHLQGVRHLIVLTSPGLAGVPVEVLVAAPGGPRRDDPVVSYAPSASMLAHLAGKTKEAGTRPATLLAVGDPAYPGPRPDPPAAPPPDGGIVLARVERNGNADLNGLRAGDVLLEYAGQALRGPDDLRVVAADAGPRTVPVKFWREGDVRSAGSPPGRWGSPSTPARPPRSSWRGRRPACSGDPGPEPGPGSPAHGGRSRRSPGCSRLGRDDAPGRAGRESVVQELARAGRLRGFQFLHFATHGQSDPRNAYRSSLALADAARSSDPEAFEADGVITADEIARTWDLDADLVVLSACESGLGRAAGGEGYLGFAQALFAKGARSLVLSLW
ncbi:MAG: CHAT domain-containing protein, partial [Singulisphaera sp.]